MRWCKYSLATGLDSSGLKSISRPSLPPPQRAGESHMDFSRAFGGSAGGKNSLLIFWPVRCALSPSSRHRKSKTIPEPNPYAIALPQRGKETTAISQDSPVYGGGGPCEAWRRGDPAPRALRSSSPRFVITVREQFRTISCNWLVHPQSLRFISRPSAPLSIHPLNRLIPATGSRCRFPPSPHRSEVANEQLVRGGGVVGSRSGQARPGRLAALGGLQP
jgi:hypothetical protein